jgi:hypothetical protein
MFNPIILLLLFPVVIAAFIVFDQLVRLEYSSYRKNWEADGQPHGFFWVPAEAKSAGGWLVGFGSSFAMQRCTFGWLFSTPEWMRRDEKALRLVFWLRILFRVTKVA